MAKLKSIDDIAKLAGVSKSTVSRALNDSPLVGVETKERIRAIAEEHSFKPSAVARNLSKRTSRTIAFVAEAPDKGECFQHFDFFDAEMMGGIAEGLYGLGYDLLILHVGPSKDDWARDYLDSGKVDGFIVMPCMDQDSYVERLVRMGAPLIAWGRGGTEFCTVRGDDRKGGRLAGRRLAGIGRRRIGFIGGRMGDLEVRERYEGFSEALEEASLDPTAFVRYCDYSEAGAERALISILSEGSPDAIFVSSDCMAIAAMRVIKSRGLRVPEDIAVIGYDNLSIASYSSPSLTTINQNVGAAGKILARDLIAFIEKGIVTTTTMPVELVVRESA